MTSFVTLTLEIEISDRQALWDKALAHMLSEGQDEAGATEIIGLRASPDIGACCAMLLDRGEHLGVGADILQHTLESDDDETSDEDGDGDEEERAACAGWLRLQA